MVDSVQIQEWLGTSHLIEDLKSNISFFFIFGRKKVQIAFFDEYCQ